MEKFEYRALIKRKQRMRKLKRSSLKFKFNKIMQYNIIEAEKASGKFKRKIVFISRIPLISTDQPLEFKIAISVKH